MNPVTDSTDTTETQNLENALDVLKSAGLSADALHMLRRKCNLTSATEPHASVSTTTLANKLAAKRKQGRQKLTSAEVLEIYDLRPRLPPLPPGRDNRYFHGKLVHSETLGPRYGVSPLTIRDIWAGRSWTFFTKHPVLPGSGAANKQAVRAKLKANRAVATKLRREEALNAKAAAKAAAKAVRRAEWQAKLAAKREARKTENKALTKARKTQRAAGKHQCAASTN